MDVSPIELRDQFSPKRLGQLDLNVGAAFGVPSEEGGKDAVYGLGCSRELQYASIRPPQQQSVILQRTDRTKVTSTVAQQKLAFIGQHQPATDAIEEFDVKLCFKVLD